MLTPTHQRARAIVITSCFIALFSLHSFNGIAQLDKNYIFRQPFSVRFTYQLLHSTHRDNFTGGSIDFDVSTSKHLMLGAGIQYAGTHLHYDNGWTLTHLRFLPVYLNSIYAFCPSCRLQPYFHTEEGISFNHYNKLDTTVSNSSYKVSEAGFYFSANIGTNAVIDKDDKSFAEIGYKGFKHSLNALDVNPHGFTMRGGFEVNQ